jgi:hypothetical protein
VAEVKYQLAVARGDVIEIDSETENEPDSEVSNFELQQLCRRLGSLCLAKFGETESALGLSQNLRRFGGYL